MGYFVYFYYNNKDELIYVGQALDVGNRWRTHTEKWKKEVCKIGIREYPDHAAMDIYEHYYIAKYQPCHNTALLHHGGTQLDIPDASEMALYTMSEFTVKFLSSEKSEKKRRVVLQYDSYDERLKDEGINVVYAESVDFFDEEVLKLDLDNTWFRWKNLYYLPPSAKQRGSRKKTNYEVNRNFLILKKLMYHAESIDKYTYAFPFRREEWENAEKELTAAFRMLSCCYCEIRRIKSNNMEKIGCRGGFTLESEASIGCSANKDLCTGHIKLKMFEPQPVMIDSSSYTVSLPSINDVVTRVF